MTARGGGRIIGPGRWMRIDQRAPAVVMSDGGTHSSGVSIGPSTFRALGRSKDGSDVEECASHARRYYDGAIA